MTRRRLVGKTAIIYETLKDLRGHRPPAFANDVGYATWNSFNVLGG